MMQSILELLKLWSPFFILIGVWIFFMSRMSKGGGFQKKCLDQMTAQTESQREIARHLDRIATSLEKRP
jgi:ATP-dependent Zn protease